MSYLWPMWWIWWVCITSSNHDGFVASWARFDCNCTRLASLFSNYQAPSTSGKYHTKKIWTCSREKLAPIAWHECYCASSIKEGGRREPKRWVGVSGWGVTVLARAGHWPPVPHYPAHHSYPPPESWIDSETTQNFNFVWAAFQIQFWELLDW